MSREAAAGTGLCHLDDIEDGEGKGFAIERDGEPIDIFVLREGSRVYGYVNSCPHLGTPLDWTADRFMSESGDFVHCSTHGALFQIEDGTCIAGPCAGDSLEPVALTLDAKGRIFLGT